MIITRQRLAEIIDEELAQVLTETHPKRRPGESYAQYKRRTEKARKQRQAKPRKETPISRAKRIIDVLKAAGYKVTSREQSAGSFRVWLKGDTTDADGLVAILGPVGGQLYAPSWGGERSVRGPGFEAHLQDENSNRRNSGAYVWLNVYKGGVRGEEEEMGIDTGDLGEMDEAKGNIFVSKAPKDPAGEIAEKVGRFFLSELDNVFSHEHLEPGTLEGMREEVISFVTDLVNELV